MKHILFTFLFFTSIAPTYTYAQNNAELWDKPIIVPRASWGANSLYNSIDGEYWKNILEKRAAYTPVPIPENIQKSRREKIEKIEEYLYWNFLEQFTSQETLYSDDSGDTYAWPIKYTETVDSIIVHHTHSEYSDTLTWLSAIHRYHSLNRQWWDIWYNYIIWYDGNIYEGREWWEYSVWAHSKYNNFWTAGIAVMWNYDSVWINQLQYQALEKLIRYLVHRYWIDLSNERYYHRTCAGNKCSTFPIETYLDGVLIWHRDATHTTCPGEELYKQIWEIKSSILWESLWLKLIKRWDSESIPEQKYNTSDIFKYKKYLEEYSQKDLLNLKNSVNILLENKKYNDDKIIKLKVLKVAISLLLK